MVLLKELFKIKEEWMVLRVGAVWEQKQHSTYI